MIDLIGGPDRDRTDDLFHAMEARSQTAPQAHIGGTSPIVVACRWFVKRRSRRAAHRSVEPARASARARPKARYSIGAASK